MEKIINSAVVKQMMEEHLTKLVTTAWVKGWKSDTCFPVNGSTHRGFSGYNFIYGLILSEQFGGCSIFATHNQIYELAIKTGYFTACTKNKTPKNIYPNGKKPQSFTFIRPEIISRYITRAEYDKMVADSGRRPNGKFTTDGTKFNLEIFTGNFLGYEVHNIAQVVPGLREYIEKPLIVKGDGKKRDAGIFGEMIKNMGIEVCQGNPAYNYKNDTISMPPSEAFIGDVEYYGAMSHEIGHATGAKHRMDRPAVYDGSYHKDIKTRAFEELVAELFSVLACFKFGLSKNPTDCENSAAYIKNWLEVFADNKGMVSEAFAVAEKALEWFIENASSKPVTETQSESSEMVA